VRILLTNDDGVDAEGILAIRAALAESAESVVTIAPEADCSGFARKCTFSRPVGVTRVSGGQHTVYRCDGTPTDCVRVGPLGGLAAAADLVVSGINHDANLADDVTYSGTIGAGPGGRNSRHASDLPVAADADRDLLGQLPRRPAKRRPGL
jgi:5'-nucleotidase